MLHAQAKAGPVYTFYSYKGGVGRSMALANVAALLAGWGKKILVVDWDLEAPGLEKFFVRPGVRLVRDTPGLVDLISGFSPGQTLDWRSGLLRAPIPRGQAIALLHAGRKEPEYLDRLRTINWPVLFEQGFGSTLEQMRDEWREAFDFTLIDSRTGITDIGGICSILLPDYVLALFTANEQSLEGVRDTMRRVQAMHATLPVDRQTLVILPIPARDESNTEYQRAAEWRGRFAQTLEPFYRDWIPKEETAARVLDYLKIPNVPFWSFGEQLPVLAEATDNPKNLSYAYALIARLMNSHLDWTEVREGGRQAMEAEARQIAESEELAAKTREVVIQAQEAERRRQEAQSEQLRKVVLGRYDQLAERVGISRLRARYVLYGLTATGAVLGIATIGLVIYDQMLDTAMTNKLMRILAQPFMLALIFIGFGCFWVGIRISRLTHQLNASEREKASLEFGGDPYFELSERDALRSFRLRVEEIFGGESSKREGGASSTPEPAPLGAKSVTLGPVTIWSSATATPTPQTVAQTAGPADVLIFYQSTPLTVDWVKEFKLLLTAWLSEVLGRDAVVSECRAPDSETVWDSALRDQISNARIAVVIVSRRAVQSSWIRQELREILTLFGDGRLIPIAFDRAAAGEIKELMGFEIVDFSDLAYVGEGFSKSDRYLDFQDRIRKLAEAAAHMIDGSTVSKRADRAIPATPVSPRSDPVISPSGSPDLTPPDARP